MNAAGLPHHFSASAGGILPKQASRISAQIITTKSIPLNLWISGFCFHLPYFMIWDACLKERLIVRNFK
jgi:hypothetical protein